MGKGGDKKVVVPSCLEHFVADASGSWGCLQNVDGELANGGEVFRRMIAAAAAGIFVEQHIEDPVQVVLDAPVGAHDREQLLGRQQTRGQEVSDLVLGGLAHAAAPAVDAGHGSDSGEAVLFCQPRCRHDDGLSAFDPIVSGSPSLACPRWLSGAVEQRRDGLEEPAPIALDGQHIMALPIADGLRRVGPAVQGVGRDNSTVQIEQREDFESASDLVAIGAFL